MVSRGTRIVVREPPRVTENGTEEAGIDAEAVVSLWYGLIMERERVDAGPAPDPGNATGVRPPDWAAASAFLCTRLRRLLPGTDRSDLDDLAQEALIDLIRTSRHEPVRNLDALLNTLAQRKATDFVRRRIRWSALVQPLPEAGELRVHTREWGTDPAQRYSFVVLQFFARHRPACEPLAQAFLAGHDWAEVAAAFEESETAVRKQWSRCVAYLRRTMGEQAVGLWAWAAVAKEQQRANH